MGLFRKINAALDYIGEGMNRMDASKRGEKLPYDSRFDKGPAPVDRSSNTARRANVSRPTPSTDDFLRVDPNHPEVQKIRKETERKLAQNAWEAKNQRVQRDLDRQSQAKYFADLDENNKRRKQQEDNGVIAQTGPGGWSMSYKDYKEINRM